MRGHYALDGKPSTIRLGEQNWLALPSVLDRLESFARHPLGTTKVDLSCCIRLLGRNGYIPKPRYQQKMSLTETLDGLEAETEDGRVYLLKNYRRFRQVPSWQRDELPFCFNFEEYGGDHIARELLSHYDSGPTHNRNPVSRSRFPPLNFLPLKIETNAVLLRRKNKIAYGPPKTRRRSLAPARAF